MLADALEHLVSGIVDHPEDVRVSSRNMRRGQMLEVRVNPEDLGPRRSYGPCAAHGNERAFSPGKCPR